MTLDFVLNEDDYYDFYLFTASQSKAVKDRRFRSWIVVTCALGGLSSLFYWDNNEFMTGYFALLAVISLFLYPAMMRNTYRKYLRKQVLPVLKNNFGKPVRIIFDPAHIIWQHFAGESKIYYSAIREINETHNHIFIPLQTGNLFIIPKFGLAQLSEVQVYLEHLAKDMNITYNKMLDVK